MISFAAANASALGSGGCGGLVFTVDDKIFVTLWAGDFDVFAALGSVLGNF